MKEMPDSIRKIVDGIKVFVVAFIFTSIQNKIMSLTTFHVQQIWEKYASCPVVVIGWYLQK
jgi:hypothetical protein